MPWPWPQGNKQHLSSNQLIKAFKHQVSTIYDNIKYEIESSTIEWLWKPSWFLILLWRSLPTLCWRLCTAVREALWSDITLPSPCVFSILRWGHVDLFSLLLCDFYLKKESIFSKIRDENLTSVLLCIF